VDYYEKKGVLVIDVVLPDNGIYTPICRRCKKVLNKIPVKERRRMGWEELGQIIKDKLLGSKLI